MEATAKTSDTRPVMNKGALKYSALARDPSLHLNHLECTSFGPMSTELGFVAASVLMPLYTAQVRVVENKVKSSNK
jgi:hypothetical protein